LAVVETTPPMVVAHRWSCLHVAPSLGVQDVVNVTAASLHARVKDPLPD
jgi:hypothetical protein